MRKPTRKITIPCPGPVESLNAAVAASVLLYEAARQRAAGEQAGLRTVEERGDESVRRIRRIMSTTLVQKSAPCNGAPLAERMRPRSLDELVGQEHLVGPGKPLRVQIERDDTSSMIFWGPPGVGKTTLAKIIAETTEASFIEFSAVTSGIKEIKQVMADAAQAAEMHSRTILFVDEIHRFNKAQQDAFLPYVERGTIRLIGATTENPSFEIISALLSRCRVYVLEPLKEEQIVTLLEARLADKERGLGALELTADDDALELIASYSSGDCRSAYNTLEVAAQLVQDGQDITTSDRGRSRATARAHVRQAGRGALQPDLGAAQERAQLRSRRRALLAGTHARGRRRSALSRAPHRAHGR